MTTKKTVGLAVFAALGMFLAGCAGQAPTQAPADPTTSAAGGGTTAASAPAEAPAEARELRLGHIYDPAHPNERCGVPALNTALEGSGLTVVSYPSATLGNEEELLEQVADGSLELSIAGPSFLGVWEPKAAVFDAAYLFETVEQFDATLNGEIGRQVWDDLEAASGLHVLRTWYYGSRHVTSNNPVRTPADLEGVKVRVPNAPLYLDNIAALGGTGTPMALAEVYIALQQGVIDAQENPIPTIDSQKFQEVQDYISLTGHVVQGTMLMISTDTLAALPPEQADALVAAAEAAGDAVMDCIVEGETEILDKWREAGAIEIIEDVDKAAFMARAVEQLPAKYPEWADLYREIQGSAG